MTNIKINVPVQITGSGGPDVLDYLAKESEYVPLYSLNNFSGIAEDYEFSKLFEARELDEANAANKKMLTKINTKYAGQQLSYHKFCLLSILCNGLCDNIVHEEIKKQLAEYQEDALKVPFIKKIEGNILENFGRDGGDYWEKFTECFLKGNVKFQKFTFASENFIVNFGYIGSVSSDWRKQNILLTYMVKRENIPFIRASWFSGIPIPENLIECWMVQPLGQEAYLKGKLKEHIYPVIEAAGIKIINKTPEELAVLWKRTPYPAFSTLSQKKEWQEGVIKGFLEAERSSLGIKPKPKYSFGSVKTKIETVEEATK